MRKINKSNNNKIKKIVSNFFIKLLSCVVIIIALLILIKKDSTLKDKIYSKVYENTFSFSKINNLYKKYFGDVLPFNNIVINDEVMVFNEKLTYKNSSIYKDGVSLEVDKNYLVPNLESGVVVFIGEKENYKNTIIIQQVNGIDVWYGNINVNNIKLYDYIEKGKPLGEVNGNTLYMVFKKEGEYLNYKDYI